MAITDDVLNELLKDYQKPEDLLGQNGLLKQLQKRLLEKAMGAELTVHLGYGKHDPAGRNSGNSRNGTTPKTLKGEFGHLELATPRDRNGSFEPQIVAKGQRRFEGFDQAIISRTLSITRLTQLRHLAPMRSHTRFRAARRVPPLSLSGQGLGQGRLSCQ